MKVTYAIAAMCCVLLAIALMAGCTGTSGTPVTTGPDPVSPGTQPVPGTSLITPASTVSSAVVANHDSEPAMTANTLYVNSTSNGGIVTVPVGDRILIRLNENPTTGYRWNATVPKGISVISDTYVPPNSSLAGAGGYREWLLEPQTVDTYTFRAVYFRPWETPQASDEAYLLVIQATKD